MLRFAEPLTPAAAEILRCCLEISADLACDDGLGDDWTLTYPVSARCFSAQLARETLLDLLDKLSRPERYAPTTYHELLMYECLEVEIACFNDGLLPGLFERLKSVTEARARRRLSPLRPKIAGASMGRNRFSRLYRRLLLGHGFPAGTVDVCADGRAAQSASRLPVGSVRRALGSNATPDRTHLEALRRLRDSDLSDAGADRC